MRSTRIVAVAALLMFAACSGAPEEPAGVPVPRASSSEEADGPSSAPSKAAGRSQGKGRARRSPEPDATRGPQRVGTGGADAASEPASPARAPATTPAAFPSAGRYVFLQRGFERFCNANACEEERLPRTGRTDIAVVGRDGGTTALEIASRMSSHGSSVASTRFTSGGARVTRVRVEFSYRGFNHTQTYEPRPPVETLRFPLRPGSSWSGSWEAATSGDYKIGVVARDKVRAAGRRITAARVVSATTFRGDFEGRADVIAWIDPETKAIVKTHGRIDLRSVFGRYVSEFRSSLASGPGYG